MKKHFAWFLVAALIAPAPLRAQPGGETGRGAEKPASGGNTHAAVGIAQLRESRRAWLKYCDAQTKFVALYNHTGSPPARNEGVIFCHAKFINQRIEDLSDVPNPY